MKSLLFFLLGSFFSLLISPKGATAQFCYAESQWTFDPPPSANGTYDAGTTVEICVDITNYMADSNWLQGMEILLPEGWDHTSINLIAGPEICDTNGQWLFLDTVNCDTRAYGPGLYFDSSNGGTLDGSPCNNYGDGCTGSTNWQFCFQATLIADCGGEGFPLAHANIMPGIHLISDGEMSANPDGFGCGFDLIVHPDLPELTFNCCDAKSGVSPGSIYACGDQPFNLYDSLLTPKDAGGAWAGPSGWTDVSGASGLGTFDPLSDPAGDYTYTVTGSGGCQNSTTIHIAALDMGVVQDVVLCASGSVQLSQVVSNVVVPTDAVWYAIGYPGIQNQLTNGYFDPAVNPPGIYTAVYTNSSGCLSTFQIQITTDQNLVAGTDISMGICDFPDLFCPFQILHDQQPNQTNNPILEGGNWILFDEDGNYLNFFNDWNFCLTANMLAQYGDSLQFMYGIGIAPCEPVFTSLNFRLLNTDHFYSTSVCPNNGPSILPEFFPYSLPIGGTWINSSGETLTSMIDLSIYPSGSIQTFYYILASDSCTTQYTLELHIGGGAGDDFVIDLCGDGSTIDLNELLGFNATPGGTWSDGPEVALSPANSGQYIYSVSDSLCSDASAVYTLNIVAPISVTNLSETCADDGSGYWVSFTISGDVSPYTIDGVPVGSSFTSGLISGGTSYSFSIDGGGPCSPVLVQGVAPVCCPLEAYWGTGNITICAGDTVDLEMVLEGGFPGTYDVDVAENGGVMSLSGLSNGDLYTVSPTHTTTYTIVSVTDGNCVISTNASVTITVQQAANAGADVEATLCADGQSLNLAGLLDPTASPSGTFSANPIMAITANSGVYSYVVAGGVCPDDIANYTINFVEAPTITSVNANCSDNPSQYTVSFEINGGVPPYQVSGGTLTGNVFVSDPISVASGETTFAVTDAGTCEPVEVTASVLDTDGDGICDAGEIAGCQDPMAANYNPLATDPGNCFYEAGAPETMLDEFSGLVINPGGIIGDGDTGLSARGIQMHVYPNPAMSDEVTVEVRGIDPSSENVELTIRDVLGNVRFEKKLKSENGFAVSKVSIENFASGVYLIQVASGGELVVGRLVVGR